MPMQIMIVASVVYFVGVILLAHFFAQPGYLWAWNTVSDLAAQGHERKWIMQAGFIGFGLLLNLGIVTSFIAAQQVHYPDVWIMLYAMAVLLSGFFCTEPLDKTLIYSHSAARWHSVFAFVAGICFNVAIVWYMIEADRLCEKLFHLGFLVAVTGTSALFGLSENGRVKIGKGLVQKVMYLISFAWLLITLH